MTNGLEKSVEETFNVPDIYATCNTNCIKEYLKEISKSYKTKQISDLIKCLLNF